MVSRLIDMESGFCFDVSSSSTLTLSNGGSSHVMNAQQPAMPEKVAALCELTGCEEGRALHLLEIAGGDVDLAASLYFDNGPDLDHTGLAQHLPTSLATIPLELVEDLLGQLHQPCPRLRDAAELREAMRDDRLPQRMRGEFCWSLSFDRSFISALLYEGFLPISSECAARLGLREQLLFVLQPKLHVHRCLLDWPNLHVSRKAKKAAKRYTLTISTAFDQVLACCVEQHGENWLYPPMRMVYSALSGLPRPDADATEPLAISFELWSHGGGGAEGSRDGGAEEEAASPSPSQASTPLTPATASAASAASAASSTASSTASTSSSSAASRRLAAGEFGVIVGQSYLSLSGFRREDSAGSVQLYLTAEVLRLGGFAYWDFGQGQPHEYKFRLGGQLVPRQSFLRRFRQVRDSKHALGELVERCGNEFTQSSLNEVAKQMGVDQQPSQVRPSPPRHNEHPEQPPPAPGSQGQGR